ncbi:MAG: alpha/beta hydrolase [Ilumatobacteraceae bacterium]
MGDRTIDVPGATLAVDDPGGEGVPFVWAHGLTWSRRQEDAAALFSWASIDGLRVIRYDARGHGESDGDPDPASYEWPRLATDLLAVMDATGVEHGVIGGASMGCATALLAALAAPGRVDRLVLAIPPTAWETRPAQRDKYLAGAHIIEKAGIADLVQRMREQQALVGAFGTDGRRRLDSDLEFLLAADATRLPAIMRGAAASDLPPLDVLATIDRPALVLAWSGDDGHPVSSAERLAAAMPRAELSVASDLGAIGWWPDLVREFVVG